MITVYLGQAIKAGAIQLWNAIVEPTELGAVAPTFSAGSYSVSVAENQTAVSTYAVSSNGGSPVTYSLTGPDAALFAISSAGVLSFLSAPNFEAAGDAGANNVYNVNVVATNTAGNASAAITVTVTDVAEGVAPTMPATTNFSIPENTTAVGTVIATAGTAPITYTLTGADAARFTINSSSGVIVANAAFDFEAPVDAGTNNVYNFNVVGTNSIGSNFTPVILTVTNVVEAVAPVLPATASFSVNENNTAVGSVTITSGTAVTYSLTGADASLFNINSSGTLTFISAPNFEAPTDNGANNTYNVTVNAVNSAGSASCSVTVNVVDVNENIAVVMPATASFSSAENQTAVGTVVATSGSLPITYTLSGADASRFAISSAGVLSWVAAPNYEAPNDVGANNIYNVTVTGTNSVNNQSTTVTVTVTDVVEGNQPVMPSTASFTVNENNTAVGSVAATGGTAPIVYSLSGVDASRFAVNVSGMLSFVTAPNYETPLDTGADNIYNVTVTATNSFGNSSTNVVVTVANVFEVTAPNPFSFTTRNNATFNATYSAVTAITGLENGTPLNFTNGEISTDNQVTWSNTSPVNYVAGATFARATGQAGSGYSTNVNVDMVVNGVTGRFSIATASGPGVIAPAFASNFSYTVEENSTGVVGSPSVSAGTSPIVYSLSSSNGDHTRFTIDSGTGVLSWVNSPDFDIPTDAGGNNVYNFNIIATNSANSATAAVAVTVTNVIEDATPSPITFAPTNNAATGVVLESPIVTLLGLESAALVPVSARGAEFSVDTGSGFGPYRSTPVSGRLNHRFRLRGQSPNSYDASVNYGLIVDGVEYTWVINSGSADSQPTALVLGTISNVAPNALVESTPEAITGISPGIDIPIIVTNLEYSINRGIGYEPYTTQNGTGQLGNLLKFRLQAPAELSTPGNTQSSSGTVSLNGVISTLTVQTGNADLDPEPILLGIVNGAVIGSYAYSEIVTIKGISPGAELPISVQNGEIYIHDGNAWSPWTTGSGILKLDYKLQVRHMPNSALGGRASTIVMINNKPYIFRSVSATADKMPDDVVFNEIFNVVEDQQILSNKVSIRGVNTAVGLAVQGGEYALNNGSFTAVSGSGSEGSWVQLRAQASSASEGVKTVKFMIGVVAYVWVIHTRKYSDIAESIAIASVSDQPLNTPLIATKVLKGITDGRMVNVTNALVSNDGGVTWSAGPVAAVKDKTLIKVTVPGSTTYLTRKLVSYSVNGVAATVSAITLPDPSAPVVSIASASTGAVKPTVSRINRPIRH